jgi:hypothetical protein
MRPETNRSLIMIRFYALLRRVRANVGRLAGSVGARVRAAIHTARSVVLDLAYAAAPALTGAITGVVTALSECHQTRSVVVAAVIAVAVGVESGAALSLLVAALWLSAKIVVLTFLLDHSLRRLPWHRVASLRRGVRVAAAALTLTVAAMFFSASHALGPRPVTFPDAPTTFVPAPPLPEPAGAFPTADSVVAVDHTVARTPRRPPAAARATA